MSYQSGDLHLTVKDKDCTEYNTELEWCLCSKTHLASDETEPYYCLPHQCDEWRIGDKKDLELLRDEINEMLEVMNKTEKQ